MAIVRQTDKRTGITYVFEQISTWNPELKQSRSKRRLLGKIDPETGEMVPTGPVGRPRTKAADKESTSSEVASLKKALAASQKKVADLSEEIWRLEGRLRAKDAELKAVNARIMKAVKILSQEE